MGEGRGAGVGRRHRSAPLAAVDSMRTRVNCAAFSPDGRRVLTASDDRYGAGMGRGHRPARRSAVEAWECCEHAAFSPDGRRIVTASEDR